MGFRPEYQGDAFTVTGRDVDAWVEVRFAGLGWVTIDPSPRANPIGTRPDQPRQTTRSGQVDDPLKNTRPRQGGTRAPRRPATARRGYVPAPDDASLWLGLGAVALLAAGPVGAGRQDGTARPPPTRPVAAPRRPRRLVGDGGPAARGGCAGRPGADDGPGRSP